MELSPTREYAVSGCKLAIFTYEGCALSLRGVCAVEYVSGETANVPIVLSLYHAIDRARQEARDRMEEAPRVLVVGASRFTLARTLLNYSVRAGRTPLLVDLDVANGNLVMPGTIAAHLIDKVIDVEEGIADAHRACTYFYGSTGGPGDNAKLYGRLIDRLAFAVNGRLAAMEGAADGAAAPNKSGAIIVGPPAGDCEEYIGHIQQAFRVSTIIVVGNERLHSTIRKAIAAPPRAPAAAFEGRCTTLNVPKSGGVVVRDGAFRRRAAEGQFRRYFYGALREFTPFTMCIAFDDVRVVRLGQEALAPASALPLGATRKVDEAKVGRVEMTAAHLLYSILAVSNSATEEAAAATNVAGFIYVTAVDEAKRQMTALATCPGRLPSPLLLQGSSLKWVEQQ